MTERGDNSRKFHLPLAELIDRMTVTQIKENLSQENASWYYEELLDLEHDIDLLINEYNIKIDAGFIRTIVQIAQINLHIWRNKDEMQLMLDDEEKYLNLLKVAHQMNGVRNRLKNQIMTKESGVSLAHRKSNFETDGLKWGAQDE